MPSPDALLLRTQTDERLAALARRGSERAFVTLVERHRRLLYASALRLVPAADADDLVQQALLSAWTALRDGTGVHHVRAWLVQIMRNTAMRQLSRRVEAEDVDAAAVAAPDDAYASFQTRATLRETLANVARLPEQQRVALLRTVVGGASQRDVAAQLGTSEGGVRQLVHRARQTLRAAATAVTPWPLLVRLADASDAVPAAGAGAGAAGAGLATKLAVGLVAAGAASTAGLAIHHDRAHVRAPAAVASGNARTTTTTAAPVATASVTRLRTVSRRVPAHRDRSRVAAAPRVTRHHVVVGMSAPAHAPAPSAPVHRTPVTAHRPAREPGDDGEARRPTAPATGQGDDALEPPETEDTTTTTTTGDDGAESGGAESGGAESGGGESGDDHESSGSGGGGATTTDGHGGSSTTTTTTTTTTHFADADR